MTSDLSSCKWAAYSLTKELLCTQVPEIPRSLKFERKKPLTPAAARIAVRPVPLWQLLYLLISRQPSDQQAACRDAASSKPGVRSRRAWCTAICPASCCKTLNGCVTDEVQAEVPRVGGRAAAEQEAREAFLNGRLARQWAGGAPWAAVDFVGVAMTAATAAAHLAAAPQVAWGFRTGCC